MSDSTLVNTYKRYKAGTQKLVKWLVRSADSCNGTSTRRPQKTRVARKVRTVDLISFAERIIASKEPLVDIPLEILDITKDAIKGRTSCAEFYASLAQGKDATPDLAESNASHQHFLQILTQVFDILRKEHKARRPKRKKKMPELATDVNDLANLYQHLELQETASISELNSIGTNDKSSKSRTKAKGSHSSDIELDNDHEETMFAIWALLKDLLDLRISVRQLFARYRQGEVSLRSVLRAASNAMHIGGLLAGEFVVAHPELPTFDCILVSLGIGWVANAIRNAQNDKADLEHVQDNHDCSKYTNAQQAAVLIPDAWVALSDVRNEMWVLRHSSMKPGLASIPCPNDLPRHPFTLVLLSIWQDLEFFHREASARRQEDHDLFDKYSHCISIMLSGNYDLDIGTTAATGIYCDIYDELGGDLGRAFKEFSPTITSRAKQALANIEAFFEVEYPYVATHMAENFIAQLKKHSDNIDQNVLKENVLCWTYRSWRADSRGKEYLAHIPLTLLHAFPLLSAHLYDEAVVNLQWLGTKFGTSMHNVLAAAHLYQALRLYDSEGTSWPDMDLILSGQHILEKPILRLQNISISVTAKQYSLALGLNINQISGSSVPKLKSGGSRIKHDDFKPIGFTDQAKYNTLRTVSRLGFSRAVGLSGFYDIVNLYTSRGAGILNRTIAQQWAETKRLSPTQLFAVLDEIIEVEAPYFEFNYIAFAMHCCSFVAPAVYAYELDNPDLPRPSRTMFEVTHDVLWEAARAEMQNSGRTSTALARSAGSLKTIIGAIGGQAQQQDWRKVRIRSIDDMLFSEPSTPEDVSVSAGSDLTTSDWKAAEKFYRRKHNYFRDLTQLVTEKAYQQVPAEERISRKSKDPFGPLVKEYAAVEADFAELMTFDLAPFGGPARDTLNLSKEERLEVEMAKTRKIHGLVKHRLANRTIPEWSEIVRTARPSYM